MTRTTILAGLLAATVAVWLVMIAVGVSAAAFEHRTLGYTDTAVLMCAARVGIAVCLVGVLRPARSPGRDARRCDRTDRPGR